MKPGCTLFFLLCSALTVTTAAHAQTPDTATTAPYLLAGAPFTFDLSISRFQKTLTARIPDLPLNEFRAIDSSPDKANLTRAASKINENLYASTALERGTLKIKSDSNDLATHPGARAKSRESESWDAWQR